MSDSRSSSGTGALATLVVVFAALSLAVGCGASSAVGDNAGDDTSSEETSRDTAGADNSGEETSGDTAGEDSSSEETSVGPDVGTDPCAGQTCSDLGECVVLIDQPSCDCVEGYRADGLSCIPEDAVPVDPAR